MKKGISVLICCYNSEKRLSETLKHLAKQVSVENIEWEIIVVNNASTDDTANTAQQEWDKYNLPNVGFKILNEPTKGKTKAWHQASLTAKYEYLLTCDDDNYLGSTYLSKVYQIMNSDPQIGALGGSGIFYPEQPVWPEIEKYKQDYVNGNQPYAATQHWVYGAGCVYRSTPLQSFYKMGWKPITIGRNGSRLDSGEDVEICFMYYLNGYKVIASDELSFKHFVPLTRQHAKYLLKLHYGISYSHVILSGYYMLMSNNQESLKENMHHWYIQVTVNLVKLIIIQLIKKTKKLGKLGLAEQIKFQQTYGTFRSLLKNKNKVINHHAQLTFFSKKFK